eukprot:6631089-Pyramimonas_sp.AAC.1
MLVQGDRRGEGLRQRGRRRYEGCSGALSGPCWVPRVAARHDAGAKCLRRRQGAPVRQAPPEVRNLTG